MSKNPYVDDMVEAYLREHGYDGLYCCEDEPGLECGCFLGNLAPCGYLCMTSECRAGYRCMKDGHEICGPNRPEGSDA